MEQLLTKAFDGCTVEEINNICPVHITYEISPEILDRIRNRVMVRIGAGSDKTTETTEELHRDHPIKRNKKLARTLLIAAIIALLAAVSALAVFWGGGRFLASLFGQENYDIVEEYILADLAQVSDGAYSLTLESALSDGHYNFVVFSISSLDGRDLGDRFPDVKFDFTLETPARIQPGFQLERLKTEEDSESCEHFIALIHSSQSAIRSMRMEINRMFAFDGSLEDLPTELKVEADFKPCPLSVSRSSTGVFRNIELSPFGLWIDVDEAWEEDDSLSEGLPIYDVYLSYKDGGQIGARAEQFAEPEYLEEIGWGGIQLPNGTHQSYISIRFEQFVDISNVKAVIIDGQEYPISLEEK